VERGEGELYSNRLELEQVSMVTGDRELLQIMKFPSFVFLAGLLLSAPAISMAAKTDAVLLVNGNSITGEIKSLEFGALRYSTDSMGTVSIDWEDIVSITTKQTLQVEVSDGTRYFGRLDSADDRFQIKVITLSEQVNLHTSRIVRMTPIDAEETFWERLEGSFSFGFDSEKSSQVTTLRSTADIGYRTRKYLLGMSATFNVTDQPGSEEENETRKRENVAFNYKRFRANRWFTDWFAGWERHDELGILSRYSAGAALGRYLVQTNLNQLSLTGGLNVNRESFIGDDKSTANGEGRIQVRYLHRRIVPEANITFTTNIFPLLEDPSIYRTETDLIFRREFIEDLYFDVTFSHSYNSLPPTGAARTDYTLTTSIGYSW
jgi:putative salt-induced outer membrane protein YdiY